MMSVPQNKILLNIPTGPFKQKYMSFVSLYNQHKNPNNKNTRRTFPRRIWISALHKQFMERLQDRLHMKETLRNITRKCWIRILVKLTSGQWWKCIWVISAAPTQGQCYWKVSSKKRLSPKLSWNTLWAYLHNSPLD